MVGRENKQTNNEPSKVSLCYLQKSRFCPFSQNKVLGLPKAAFPGRSEGDTKPAYPIFRDLCLSLQCPYTTVWMGYSLRKPATVAANLEVLCACHSMLKDAQISPISFHVLKQGS